MLNCNCGSTLVQSTAGLFMLLEARKNQIDCKFKKILIMYSTITTGTASQATSRGYRLVMYAGWVRTVFSYCWFNAESEARRKPIDRRFIYIVEAEQQKKAQNFAIVRTIVAKSFLMFDSRNHMQYTALILKPHKKQLCYCCPLLVCFHYVFLVCSSRYIDEHQNYLISE